MFAYGFMVDAFLAASLVALLCGPVGFVLVLRRQVFAGHALAHLGFTGAAGALLVGAPPLAGLVTATLLGGAAMGALGDRLADRDVGIGIVLSLGLGVGMLLLSLIQANASTATALLFGNVLGVDRDTLVGLAAITAAALAAFAFLSSPLLLASFEPELAEARGTSLRAMSVLFLSLLAFATAGAAEIVGVLLVFTLLVAPAATAQRLTARLWPGIALSTGIAVSECWLGLVLAWWTDLPTSFWITALGAGAYLGARFGVRSGAGRRERTASPAAAA